MLIMSLVNLKLGVRFNIELYSDAPNLSDTLHDNTIMT
jgi:hypothetical protein